ncbi:MAG: antitoxin VapB family protein [Candidatus Nanohaloarchaea archaeon]|nr:antitoxin VapB family protein [Candidatus Nanohaloarchaea archaeon]
MSRTISVSDDVYEWMKNHKRNKSFSEFIRENIAKGDLSELSGIGFSGDWEKIKDNLKDASKRNKERIKKVTA